MATKLHALNPVRLGRLRAADARDQRYSMGNHLATVPPKKLPTSKFYRGGPILDQGSTPRCVGFSIAGVIAGGPIMQLKLAQAQVAAAGIYSRAQQVDEWPGEAYDGASVRAGFKAAVELGYFAEYVWAWDLATSTRWLLEGRGEVVDGIDWYDGFFNPVKQKDGSMYVEPTGSIAGGHAIRRIGYSAKRKASRWANSWGPSWGENGLVWIHDDVLSDLLRYGGESCTGTEVRLARKTLGRPVGA